MFVFICLGVCLCFKILYLFLDLVCVCVCWHACECGCAKKLAKVHIISLSMKQHNNSSMSSMQKFHEQRKMMNHSDNQKQYQETGR